MVNSIEKADQVVPQVKNRNGQAFASERKARNSRLRAALEAGVSPDEADLKADKTGYVESWKASNAHVKASGWTQADSDRLIAKARKEEKEGPAKPASTGYSPTYRPSYQTPTTGGSSSGYGAGTYYDPYAGSDYGWTSR